jgi:phosphohistidine swiveling domain-containing protein
MVKTEPAICRSVVRMGEPLAPRERVGGKGHQLARLAHHGLPVPRFVLVTVEAFEQALAPILPELDRLAALAPPAEAERAARELLSAVELPDALAKEILAALSELGPAPHGFAVRSSAVDEDSALHSFAGLHDSFLGRRPQTVPSDIVACWASAFGERALCYRRQHGLAAVPRVAVILQEMIPSERAGVVFTADPIGGHPEHSVVSAAYGLGEGVVSGQLECDTWVVCGAGQVLREEIRSKDEQIVLSPEGGTAVEVVAAARRQQPVLSPEQLRELLALCRVVEQEVCEAAPQDIEWCMAGGALYLLQARPIARFAGLRKKGPLVVFDNSNVVESYAGVPSPLTYSFASACFRGGFRGVLQRLGIPARTLGELEPLLQNMLGYVHGRMYYNLLHWYGWFRYVPTGGNNVREFDRLIGLVSAVGSPTEPEARSLFERLVHGRARLTLAWKLWTIERIAADFQRDFYRVNGRYLDETFERHDNRARLAVYREIFEHATANWDAEILNFIGAQRAFADLSERLTALGVPDVQAVQNDLVGGDGAIASMRPTREMMLIARAIRADARLTARFLQQEPAALREDPELAQVRPQIDAFLREYGCRCMNELKLEEPTLREDPTFLFETLREYVRHPPDEVLQQLARQVDARARAERALLDRLPWRSRRQLLRALERVRRHVYLREELRLVRGKLWGIVRRLFRAMGHDLARSGVLASPQDIFHLKVDEIAELVEGRSPELGYVRELVALRARERAENLARPAPSRIYAYGDICAASFVYAQASAPTPGTAGALCGTPCGPGLARGPAYVSRGEGAVGAVAGTVLVAERTDPGWIPLYPSIRGLVIERGSVLSHSAVVAREMGIPTVVGVTGACAAIRTGDLVSVDGGSGRVEILERSP